MAFTSITGTDTEILPVVVQFHPVIEMTDDQFFEFCQNQSFITAF